MPAQACARLFAVLTRLWVQEVEAELPALQCPYPAGTQWGSFLTTPRWGPLPSALMSLLPFGEKAKHELGSKSHNQKENSEKCSPTPGSPPPSSSSRSQRGEHLHVPSRGHWRTDGPPGPSGTRRQPSLLLLPAHPHPGLPGRARLLPPQEAPCDASPALLPAPHRPSLHRRCPRSPRSPPAWATWGARRCPWATSPTPCR